MKRVSSAFSAPGSVQGGVFARCPVVQTMEHFLLEIIQMVAGGVMYVQALTHNTAVPGIDTGLEVQKCKFPELGKTRPSFPEASAHLKLI